MDTQTCLSCGKVKNVDEFYLRNRSGTLRRRKCIPCHVEAASFQKKLKSKQWERQESLRKYGLTTLDYNKMLLQQEGKCPICGDAQLDDDKVFCVDHSHETGKVRSLLCSLCNVGLGAFKDNIIVLTKAIEYLQQHSKKEQ